MAQSSKADWQQLSFWQDLSHNILVAGKNLLAMLPGDHPAWVVIELKGSYPSRKAKQQLFQQLPFIEVPASLEALERDIEALAEAPWLEGVAFILADVDLGLTQAYALRALILRLREAGKDCKVSAQQLNLSSYVVASAAAEIIVPESAELELLGFSFDLLYQRDAWARYGVQLEKLAIKEYKTAFETTTAQQMSEANREQLTALADSLETTLLTTIARARQVDTQEVKTWIDEAVSSAQRALELGMIDRIAYEDQWLSQDFQTLADSQRFIRAKRRKLGEGRIAVISLEGSIVSGKSGNNPLPLPLIGGKRAGSTTLVQAFRQAERDEATKAIVFFVNSGGGSALASDLIWREVVRIREHKPIVAVMGSVAASGGYYVLTHAHEIIASATTITGSIGVLSAKVVMRDFYDRYGFQVESISRGALARMMKADHAFTAEEQGRVQRSIEEVYQRFTMRVAEGRGLSQAGVDEIGRGRIWSGQDALAIGLVDSLGDIHSAIERARSLAALSPQASTWNVHVEDKLKLPQLQDSKAMMDYLLPLLKERVLLTAAVLPQI